MHARDEERRQLRFTISRDKAGLTLLGFLAGRFTYFTAEAWRERIADGRITLNGKTADPDRPLAAADLIEYRQWDVPEPPVDTRFTVVYRDDGLLAVDKPAGLPCHPGGRYFRNTLTLCLRRDLGLADAVLVNRLDRETSGLVLLALDRRLAGNLQRQFAGRSVKKRYTVFVEGEFPPALRAEGYIVADPDSPVRKKRAFLPRETAPAGAESMPGADWAVTEFSRVRSGAGLSELDAAPETGRLHQIRATLRALGFPVVGDKLYGVDPTLFLRFCDGRLTDDDRRRLRMDRQALHAAELRLRHPRTGRALDLHAPLPADLCALRESMAVAPPRDA